MPPLSPLNVQPAEQKLETLGAQSDHVVTKNAPFIPVLRPSLNRPRPGDFFTEASVLSAKQVLGVFQTYTCHRI
jgi:hypothetical protein